MHIDYVRASHIFDVECGNLSKSSGWLDGPELYVSARVCVHTHWCGAGRLATEGLRD